MRRSAVAARPAAGECAVESYARAVGAGEVVAGRLVRLMAERHLRDLATGADRGLVYDREAAERSFRFFESVLCFYEGEDAGKPFRLQPFQKFIVGSLRGWRLADGTRRFRKAYIEMGKGNGKTPLAAGIGIEDLVVGSVKNPGSQIYSAAMTADAARLMYTDSRRMVEASPMLRSRLRANHEAISNHATASYFKPVSGEANNLHGKRVRTALIDEIHAHPTNEVVDFMQKGTKGPGNRLILEITNSGHDRSTICWEHHQYSVRVLEQAIEDDGWFAFVCNLDVCAEHVRQGKDQPQDGCETGCDQWDDPATWAKANPNLGVSVTVQYLAEQVREAKGIPSQQNATKRLNFCIWTESVSRWLDMEVWRAAPDRPALEDLEGRECFLALDLSSVSDLSAVALLFPDGEGGYDLHVRYWLPEAAVAKRRMRGDIPIDQWVQAGLITVCEGEIIDYDAIEAFIVEANGRFAVRECAFDGWQAAQAATHLGAAGVEMVKLAQGFGTYTEPMKEFERLLKMGKLRHGGDPVLTWMASNVSVEQGANLTRRPSRAKSVDKIDGIVASLMAMARAIVGGGDGPSVYEERGLLVL